MDSVKKDLIVMNLQLFAGDKDSKTEKATPKKRKDVRKKGQVFQSREIAGAIVLLGIFAVLKLTGGFIYANVSNYLVKLVSVYPMQNDLFSEAFLRKLYLETIVFLAKVLLPILGTGLVAGLAIGYGQVGFLFSSESMMFKFSRINPINGIKRMLSSSGLVELLKSVIKIIIIGYVSYSFLMSEANNILNLMDNDIKAISAYIINTLINAAFRVCIVLLAFGIIDYLYQWWEYERSIMMSKEEIKEEFKQTEGNPTTRSRIRQKQRQISSRRMLHSVPKADVVVVNPTHIAVAIKYDPKIADAPVVTAKGQGYLALRIKEIAEENDVYIVENKPLARTLYETVEIDQAIPPELYQAVAEILAFVYRLKNDKIKG
ncbi:MAG TPA: flagellar biosynthesis protein FlhB [Clostridiaceae bacterium]|nr:flagellar biosynthesis protein FlhB [Clostridiaceae bacterium]